MPPRAPAAPKPERRPGRKQKILAEFRRGEILTAATKVFGNKGFEATRMDDIARCAKLAKGTLYLYFRSKDAVYQATVQQALERVATLTDEHVRREATFAGKLAAFIRIRLSFWTEQQAFYRVILSAGRDGQNRKRSIAWQRPAVLYLESILQHAAAASEIPPQDFLAAAWAIMDVVRGANERRVYAEGRDTEEDARFLTAFLTDALHARRLAPPA